MLFGTGTRGVSGLSGVKVSAGGIDVPALSAEPQAQYDGLDQVNIELTAPLAGNGQIPLLFTADGQATNTITIDVR